MCTLRAGCSDYMKAAMLQRNILERSSPLPPRAGWLNQAMPGLNCFNNLFLDNDLGSNPS